MTSNFGLLSRLFKGDYHQGTNILKPVGHFSCFYRRTRRDFDYVRPLSYTFTDLTLNPPSSQSHCPVECLVLLSNTSLHAGLYKSSTYPGSVVSVATGQSPLQRCWYRRQSVIQVLAACDVSVHPL